MARGSLFALLLIAACASRAPVRVGAPGVEGEPRRHVSPAGDDAHDCRERAPCRTVTRALEGAGAGTIIVLADGHYPAFTVDGVRATAARPLVIVAPSRGAVIDPGDARDTIFVERSSHVVLDGLRSFGARRAAVRVSGGHHVTVRHGVFGDNTRWGIFTDFTDDFVAEGNHLYGSREEHGLYVSNTGDRPVLRFNVVHRSSDCGIQINADEETRDEDHVYEGTFDGLTTGARIERNVVFANGKGGGAAINLDGVQDSVVRENVLFDGLARAIVVYGDADGIPGDGLEGGDEIDGHDGNGHRGPSGMRIERNTAWSPPALAQRGALLLRYSHGTRPNVVRNNVLLHAGRASLELGGKADLALLESDENLLVDVRIGARTLDLAGARALGLERRSAAPPARPAPAAGSTLRARLEALDYGAYGAPVREVIADIDRELPGVLDDPAVSPARLR